MAAADGVTQDRDAWMSSGLRKLSPSLPTGASPPPARADRHAVNHVERLTARIHGGGAANPERQAAAGLVVVDDWTPGTFVAMSCAGR
jgi:hypothetical protein